VIALVQRVTRAHVEIGGATVGAIGAGALVFVCAEPADTPALAERLVAKLLAAPAMPAAVAIGSPPGRWPASARGPPIPTQRLK